MGRTTYEDVVALYKDPRLIRAIEKWDVLEFLDNNAVDYVMDGKNIGTDFVGVAPCPQCGDTRYHYGINIKEKFGSCFICKAHYRPLKLVSLYAHVNLEKAFNYLVYSTEQEVDVEDIVKKIIYGDKKQIKNYSPTEKDKFPNAKLLTYSDININPKLKKLMIEKGITFSDIKKYEIHIQDNEILWPVYFRNHLVSYQKRNFKFKRYNNPDNLSKFLYRTDEIPENSIIILVEGFFDYIKINNFISKYYKDKIYVTTGMLKSLSREQIQKLKLLKPSNLIVMFDRDSWFDYFRLKKLMPFDVNYLILPRGKDPNELTTFELNNLFKKEIKQCL